MVGVFCWVGGGVFGEFGVGVVFWVEAVRGFGGEGERSTRRICSSMLHRLSRCEKRTAEVCSFMLDVQDPPLDRPALTRLVGIFTMQLVWSKSTSLTAASDPMECTLPRCTSACSSPVSRKSLSSNWPNPDYWCLIWRNQHLWHAEE